MAEITFLAQFPPPYHGLSNAVDVLYRSRLAQKYQFQKIDLKHNKTFPKTITNLLLSRSDLYYFTIAQSVSGNLRDLVLLTILRAKKAAVIVHLHGGYYKRLYAEQFSPVQKWANRRCFKSVNRAIVLGDSLRDMFEAVLPSNRISVVRNCVDDEMVCSEADFQAKLNSLPGKQTLTVLYLSNFIREKGWFEVLQLADLAKSAGLKLKFVFAGKFFDPAEQAAFEEFTKRTHLDDFIKYLGVVSGPAKAALLKEADIFILPTRYPKEGQPLSIIEAMANGHAVICTPHSGIPDIVTDQVNGFFHEKDDLSGMQRSFETFLGDRALMVRMAHANRKRAQEFFSQDQYLGSLEKIFDEVLANDVCQRTC